MNPNPKRVYPELMESIFPGGLPPDAVSARTSGDFYDILRPAYGSAGFEWESKDVQLTCRMLWAFTQWMRSGKPIVRLSQELVDFLLEIDIPEEIHELPPMPWDGFWVVLSGFDLIDSTTGAHAVEGFYLCKDTVMAEGFDRPGPGLLALAVGESKGGAGIFLDDTIHYFGIAAGVKLKSQVDEYGHGLEKVCRVLVNLLLLWASQNSPLQMTETIPPRPTSPKKQKRLDSQGRSSQKYWSISLNPSFRFSEAPPAPDASSGPMHLTMVRGHYRTYWVEDAQGAAALGHKRTEAGKALVKVRRFISPHRAWRRGEDPVRNVYEVTK